MDAFPSTEDLIGNFYAKANAASKLVPDEFELIGIARVGTEKMEIPVESIENIETGEQQGTVVMHLKHEADEHKVAIAISGATLLALGAFVIKKRFRK